MAVLLAGALALGALVANQSESDVCVRPSPPARSRPVLSRDLATLTDIGRSDPYDSTSLFGISPDGNRIAYVIRRGDPASNSFCQQLVIQELRGDSPPRLIEIGGELIRMTISIWGLAALPTGSAAIIQPRWSPDGKEIAFLKRVAGSTQVWVATVATGALRQATAQKADVDDFSWLPNGQGLVVATRPALHQKLDGNDSEGRAGYLFDDRFSPMESNRPFVRDPVDTRYDRVDIAAADVSAASPGEVALLRPPSVKERPSQARLFARSGGASAWTEPTPAGQWLGPDRLFIADSAGKRQSCSSAECAHVRRLWWQDETLFWISRTGWGQNRTALYRWGPGDNQPHLLLETGDNLIGCSHDGWTEICAREGSVRPRRIEAIDLRSGASRVLFDPNAGFSRLTLGEVHRYFYQNAFGIECWFDLVMPVGHRPGQRHPMVVVQYTSQGFLRGGTGDEVPIQVLAAQGFAVLSFEHPDFTPQARLARNELELRQIDRRNWLERRNVESALERAVQIAIRTGTVDPSRIGISGFSEGSAAVQWALINSKLFTVASLGTCCEDKVAQPLNGGPGYEQHLREQGYPAFDSSSDRFWAPYSLVQNADHIRTPILLQVGDSEYQMGLDVIAAMRERGRPFEAYIFPNEPHIKWQPAHRLAVYDRNLEWFEFWLRHRIDCSPEKQSQYARWIAMSGAPSRSSLLCFPVEN